MTDIVERLRDHDRHIRGRLIEGLTDLVIDDMVEAADEIERLRDALAPFGCTCIEGYCQYQQFDGGSETCPHNIARAALEEKE